MTIVVSLSFEKLMKPMLLECRHGLGATSVLGVDSLSNLSLIQNNNNFSCGEYIF